MASKGKKLKTDRKKGVPFKMMFRHHMDPDYYDPKANDKIFVPDVPQSNLSEKQKQIIESFPERDRGIFNNDGTSSNIIEEDPLEAVVKKMKLKKKEKQQEKKKKVTFDGDFAIKDGDHEDEEEDDDVIGDSDEEEEEYDEEDDDDVEDEEEDKEEIIEEVKGQKIKVDDANVEVKKIQKMKPAEGVKFTMYDEYGLPKNDGFDYQQFIVTDDLRPTDLYIPAPPEMVERMLTRTGYHRDVDKEINEMTEEEKAVFMCMTDDVGEYDELEDDFLFLANEGKPAIVEAEPDTTANATQSSNNENLPEFANKGVVIVKDEEEEKLKAMREKYKKQLGIGMPKNDNVDDDEEEEVEYDDEEDLGHDVDDNKKDFMDVLDYDYADDQIGDVDVEEQEDLITKEMLDEAVEEFIESQKLRDRKLYKEFKGDDKPDELIPQLKTKAQIDEEERETEQEKEELRKKALALAEVLEKEMEERGSDYSERDPYDHSSDEEDRWDCNTILTTHTNKDNHPGVIKTNRVVKQKNNKIELHKQFKVPIDGLMAQEITVNAKLQQQDKKNKQKLKGPYEQVDEEIESDNDDNSDSDAINDNGDTVGDPKDQKKQRKQQQKQEKREKRKLKKELKLAFKQQNTKLVKATTTEIGQIKSGVSIKKIY